MHDQKKYSTRQIILDFTRNVEIFIKDETENNKDHLIFLGFKRILFGDVEFENKSGFWVVSYNRNRFWCILSKDVENNIKFDSSFQIFKRVFIDDSFGPFFEEEINNLYDTFYRTYNKFFEENIEHLLQTFIDDSNNADIRTIDGLFQTPDIYIYSFANHQQKTTRWKPGEGRDYRHIFNHRFSLICNNESISNEETYTRIKKYVDEFENETIEDENDLSMSSKYESTRFFNGEIDYDISYLANHNLKVKDYFRSQEFINSNDVSLKYRSIYNSRLYFLYYIYLLILFFKVEEIVSLLVANNNETEKNKFHYFFTLYQFLLGEVKIITGIYNVNHSFEIDISKTFEKEKDIIIEKVKSRFSIENLDKALENYYINRPNEYEEVCHKEDLKNLYIYFKKYLI